MVATVVAVGVLLNGLLIALVVFQGLLLSTINTTANTLTSQNDMLTETLVNTGDLLCFLSPAADTCPTVAKIAAASELSFGRGG